MTQERSAEFEPIYGSQGGFPYVAYLPYYPTRFDVSDKEELLIARSVVWGFKDGQNSQRIAESFSESQFSGDNAYISNPQDWVLCIIPASTQEKTRTRFETFVRVLSDRTGLQNGYNCLYSVGERESKHLLEDRNSVQIMDHIAIQNVRGKNILLFDDVYTTGRSFLKVANALKANGATEIKGMFLAKTHWLEDE